MPPRSPAGRSGSARLAAGLLILAATLGWAAPAPAAGDAPARPAPGGAMVGWHEKGDDLDDLRAHEAALGKRFAVVRVYQQWKPPSDKVDTLVGEGRLVVVSHKPPAGGWAAVASGAEDATIATLADRYRAYGRQVVFVFHHEPHDDAVDIKRGTAGTSTDYLAAWRRIHAVFAARGAHRSVGGNVHFGYSATGSWALAAAKGQPAGTGDPLYPGSDIVDVLAHDRYNWAGCRGDGWEEFSENWAPLVALASRLGKPLIAGEFGSAPAGGARNDWFRRGAEWMRTDPLARQWLWGFAYYHSLHETCPWDFLNAPADDGASGWREAFSHPYFSGTPFALPTGAVAPVTPLPSGPAPTAPAPSPTTAPAAPKRAADPTALRAPPVPASNSAPVTAPAPAPAVDVTTPAAGPETRAAGGQVAAPAAVPQGAAPAPAVPGAPGPPTTLLRDLAPWVLVLALAAAARLAGMVRA